MNARAPLIGAVAGMEVCWRYAWATFCSASLLGQAFPLPEATATFVAAALLTTATRRRAWRVVWTLLLHTTGVVAGTLWILHGVNDPAAPLWDTAWMRTLIPAPGDVVSWLILAVNVFWAVAFWVGGTSLARRNSDHGSVCNRFDLGIAAFLALFVLRWMIQVKGGVVAEGPSEELLSVAYFLFGALAVGLARNLGGGSTSFADRGRGLGFSLGLLGCAVLLGIAVALLFLPHLTAAAAVGYQAVRRAAEPLGPVVVQILRFLLVGRQVRSEGGAGQSHSPDLGRIAKGSGGGGELERLALWGFGFLITLLLVFALVLLVWALARWLFSKSPNERGKGPEDGLAAWLAGLLAALLDWLGRLLPGKTTFSGAATTYAALRSWGLRSGMPAVASETPLEYSHRLRRRFPTVQAEVEEIVNLFHAEVYGGQTFEPERRAPASRALARMCSPRLWPSRLRSRLRGADDIHGPGLP